MSSASAITDHKEIQRWAQEHGGRPACVKGTGQGDDPGILRLDFGEKDEELEEIPWERWFKWFDKNNLALLRSPDTGFNKLVSREH